MAEDLAKAIVHAAAYLQENPRPMTYASVEFDQRYDKVYACCVPKYGIHRFLELADALNFLEDQGFRCKSADLEALSRLHITKTNIVVLFKLKEET